MRIQHLLYEPRRSGISQHVISVVRSLPALEHHVVLPEGLVGVSQELTALGAQVDVVPLRSRVLPRSTWRGLPRRIRTVRADVLHIHSLEAGGFGAVAARLAGAARVVFTPQTVEIRRRALLGPFLRVVSLLGRRHAAWVGVSRGQVARLQRLAPRERVHWIPNAAPPTRPLPQRDEARKRLGWPLDRPVVACVGRLAAQKDPWTFVRALRRLAPGVRGVLIGEGPLHGQLTSALDTTPGLELQGFVRDVLDVYAAADIVCLSSRWEGLPYSLLEALSHGLPVAASAIEGNLDLVRHGQTGLTFPAGDDRALAGALGELLGDPALARRLGEAGRELVEGEFSEPALGARLQRLYAGVAASR